MRRIALHGGSFDPPTRGHAIVAAELLSSGLCDEVWILPCGDGRVDKRLVCSAQERFEMCRLQVGELFEGDHGDSRIKVSDFEASRPYVGTVRLLREMRQLYPDFAFGVVIGSDLLPQLASWLDAAALLSEVHFFVIFRGAGSCPATSCQAVTTVSCPAAPLASGTICKCELRAEVAALASPPRQWSCVGCSMAYNRGWRLVSTDESSTEARKRLASGARDDELATLLSPSVRKFIKKRNLYAP